MPKIGFANQFVKSLSMLYSIISILQRAVANPFKRKWKLGLTNNATGFAEYAEVKTRARAYDVGLTLRLEFVGSGSEENAENL